MFSKADKIQAPIINRSPSNSGPAFFRKADEENYAGEQSQPAFFAPPVQAKLAVSQPDDTQEKEADTVAEKVMRMPEPLAAPGVKKEEETGDRESTQPAPGIQRKADRFNHTEIVQRSGRDPPGRNQNFENELNSTRGYGSPLPGPTLQFMQNRFNADFGNVRVHTGSNAQNLSNSVHAQAFTHGNDIYFNSGKYSPDTEEGGSLLAHELTHTIQQGAGHALVQRKVIDESLLSAVDLSAKAGARQLPQGAKDYLQDYYKTDLSGIRIHSDSEIASLCRAAGINSFTRGADIAIPPSAFDSESEQGAVLLSGQVSESLKQRGIRSTRADGNDIGGPDSLISQILNAIKENKAKAESMAKEAKGPPSLPGTKEKKQEKPSEGEKEAPGKKGDAKKHKKPRPGVKDSEGISIKPVKHNPKKSPSSPAEDPAFLKVVMNARKRAKDQKQHETAEKKSAEAQKNAGPVPNEAESKAQNRKTDGMGEASKVDKPFDAASFKADLLKKIEEITPKTLEEATEFKENNKIESVKGAMGEKVASEKESTTGPVDKAVRQPLQVNPADNKQAAPLPPTSGGPMPAGISAANAAPKKKFEGEISMQEQSRSLDEEMKANNVSEKQLESSNEPTFTAALDEKRNAQKDAVEKPAVYRKEETVALKEAKVGATEKSTQALAGMHGARGKNFASAVAHQQTAKQKDEERRATVAKTIEDKYALAEQKVNTALADAEKMSNELFDQGAEAARVLFENYVDAKMRAYKRKRYSGFWGGLKWAKDKLFGMPDEVDAFYTDGRELYLKKMDEVITQVANVVTLKLNEAKQAITDGKKDIDEYVNKLPKDLQDVGKEAADNIRDKFDALEQSVNDKRDALIDGLAKKYVDNVKKLDERIGELKEANKGLIDKAIGFLKKVWQVIKDLVNLFTTILAKLASIIGLILDSPSGFFDNLGKAFRMGFDNFKNKFLDYLEIGLMEWLATNLGIKGIELPKKFDASAIFSLALQVMGITKVHIRERAVVLLGERKVSLLEKAGGLIYRVYNEGLGVIWDMIVEKLSDFKEMVWDAIKSFIQKSIIEAALVFLLSLLNPIGAFIKVCMAIYDFLMMLVRFKDRILELLDTILNAVMNIASGAVEGAAAMIEKAFAKSISVIIGFLAALLHLNNIFAKIRDIITRVRKRVEKALDWVIMKAYSIVGKVVEGALKLEDKGREMIEKGKEKLTQAGKAAAAKIKGWAKKVVGMEKPFAGDDGSVHRLFYDAAGETVVIMINPQPAGDYERWVKNIEAGTDKKKQKKQQAIAKAGEIDTAKKQKANTPQEENNLAIKMRTLLDELSEITGHLFTGEKPDCSKEGNGLTFGNLYQGYGKSTTASTLTNINMPPGSVPSVTPHRSFSVINQRRNKGGSYYILGHLLNHNLGGTGKDWKNLTPLTRDANSAHEKIAESRVKNAVNAGNIVFYRVEAEYGRSVPKSSNKVIQEIMQEEAKVPVKLVCEAEMITPAAASSKGTADKVPLVPKNTEIVNNVSQDPKDYDLTGIKREPVYLDSGKVPLIAGVDDVNQALAQKIADAFMDKYKTDKTRFSSFDALADYKFSDGRSFTDLQKKTIKGLPDLGYVHLFST